MPNIKKSGFLFFFILYVSSSYGQLERLKWYFGTSSVGGFQFDKNTMMLSLIPSKYSPYAPEGCGVAVDGITGDLLFYTDGINVVDKNDLLMPNSGLSGHSSCSQSGLVVKKPGTCSQYYVLSGTANGTVGRIYFSTVDMTLAGNGTIINPLGDVVATEKNILLGNTFCEAMMVVARRNSDEYWLLAPLFNSSLIEIYLISSTGITYNSNFDSGIVLSDIRNLRYDNINNRIAITSFNGSEPAYIVDFDNANGTLSNLQFITGIPLPSGGGVADGIFDSQFSPDGTKLYLSNYRTPTTGGNLYQYDLENPLNPPNLIYTIGSNNRGHAGLGLQTGPDSKIYWLYVDPTTNTKRYIGIINTPNILGAGCDFNPKGFDMGATWALGNAGKFPEFVYDVYTPVVMSDLTVCDEPVELQFDFQGVINAVEWVLEDPVPSGTVYHDISPIHTFNDNGVFEVKVTITDNCGKKWSGTSNITVSCDLPVQMTNFEANLIDDNILLVWETVQEINNKIFEIQRSDDGKQFYTIGSIAGKDFSSIPLTYSYIDQKPLDGDVYYRVVQFDYNGNTNISQVRYLQIGNFNNIKIFPNPFTNQTKILFPESIEAEIIITDLVGRNIIRKKVEPGEREILFGQNILQGQYILKLISDSQTQSFILFKD